MKHRGEQGFTLFEVLVAFAILSVSLGLLYQIVFASLERTVQAGSMQNALAFAQSKLAIIGTEIPLESRTLEGRTAQGLVWSLVMAEQDNKKSARDWRLYEAKITVTWEKAGRRNETSLATLKIKREDK